VRFVFLRYTCGSDSALPIGTSVSVFFIVPTSGEPTSADFSLDGGMFTAHFDGPSQNGGLGPYLYNTTSCEINGLANKTHTLEVSSSAGTMLVFDYAQYMYVPN
jgi:hypothetical protein